MCRLGGVVLSDRPRTIEEYQEMAEDLLGLLVNMERALGGDGNSIAFHYPNGEYRIIKEDRPSPRLFHRFNEIQKNLMDGAIIVQMHARLSTCDPSKYHENMHPFTHEPIIGCHNGGISDEHIWKQLEKVNVFPYSTTDSEAIFAAMSVFSPTLRPVGVQTVLDELDGSYAITAVTQEEPNMLLMIAADNPLVYFTDKKRGTLWYASTTKLFPESLSIPTRRIRKKYTKGKKKGKKYTTRVPNIRELEYGEGLYVRSHRKHVSVESKIFDVWSYSMTGWGHMGTNLSVYGQYLDDKYSQYDEDWDWDWDYGTKGGEK